MNSEFRIQPHSIHLWRARLTDLLDQETEFFTLLSADEKQRAQRFKFPQHRVQFTLARGVLRKILGLYTEKSPQEIEFDYGSRGKPGLKDNHNEIQFNVSHSEDCAVYAMTRGMDVGIDIQKIAEAYHEGVAKRFFSVNENTILEQLPEALRAQAFCQLWSCKESLIKAVGEGLYVPLGDFTVDLNEQAQKITLSYEGRTEIFYLEQFVAYPDYKSAFATNEPIHEKIYWEWFASGPKTWRL